MAWLEVKNSGQYHIAFRFGNQKFKRSLRTTDRKDAEAAKSRVDENIRLVERGRLTLPDDADVAAFLISDGKLKNRVVVAKQLTIRELFSRYQSELPSAAMEQNSRSTVKVHLRHIERLLGRSLPLHEVTSQTLQAYVQSRSVERGLRGSTVSPTTIRKEMTTFKSVWNWGNAQGAVTGQFPSRDLKYPKGTDKPPFQTWQQIERRISRGGLSENEILDLWDCLYLRTDEIGEVLGRIKQTARHGFIYPMIQTAAHTGARRSELIRARIDDFDLVADTLHVREKKRVRGRITMRVVPISKPLGNTLKNWFSNHPGGQSAFCIEPSVSQNRTHSEVPQELTVGEADHHFNQPLHGSKWTRLRGWHVFRHSFASNCAAQGVDQRMINEWMGHQTDAMVKRYRHLFPDQQQPAVNSVFA